MNYKFVCICVTRTKYSKRNRKIFKYSYVNFSNDNEANNEIIQTTHKRYIQILLSLSHSSLHIEKRILFIFYSRNKL